MEFSPRTYREGVCIDCIIASCIAICKLQIAIAVKLQPFPEKVKFQSATFKIDRDPDALFQTQFRFARIVQRRKFFRDDLV